MGDFSKYQKFLFLSFLVGAGGSLFPALLKPQHWFPLSAESSVAGQGSESGPEDINACSYRPVSTPQSAFISASARNPAASFSHSSPLPKVSCSLEVHSSSFKVDSQLSCGGGYSCSHQADLEREAQSMPGIGPRCWHGVGTQWARE